MAPGCTSPKPAGSDGGRGVVRARISGPGALGVRGGIATASLNLLLLRPERMRGPARARLSTTSDPPARTATATASADSRALGRPPR
jgi:hypothetical protein